MANEDLETLIEKLEAEISKLPVGTNIIVLRMYLDNIKKRHLSEMAELEAELKNLRHKVRHDSLTDLGNYIKLEETLHNYQSQKKPVTIINLDLKGLKTVNDKYGYDSGNDLIKLAAQYLSAQSTTRSTDMVFRAGEMADEFYVLTEEINPNNIKKFIIRLIENAKKHRLHIKHGDDYEDVYLGFYSGYAVYDGVKSMTAVKKDAHTGVVQSKTEAKGSYSRK